MKKLISIRYSEGAFNFSMLLIRVLFGLMLIISHGYPKLMKFNSLENGFYSFMGMGSKASLILTLFAEILCSLFVVMGLFTRIAVLPLVIMFLVIIFGAQAGKPFVESELALFYFSIFFFLLLCGPGKFSVDAMISKR